MCRFIADNGRYTKYLPFEKTLADLVTSSDVCSQKLIGLTEHALQTKLELRPKQKGLYFTPSSALST